MSRQIKITTFADLIEQGVLEIGDGYRAKLEELGGDGPVFLRAGLLVEQGFDWAAAERFRSDTVPKLRSKIGRPGDTMVTTKGNSVGRTAYVPPGAPEFVYSPHLSYWRTADSSQLSSGFLRYWSRSPEFSAQLESMSHSTDMAPYLSLADQRRLRISLPSILIQEAIAKVLGALDDKIAINDQIANTALHLAMAEYEMSAHSGQFSRAVSMADCAEWFSGGTPRTSEESYWGGDIPWISALSLKSPWIDDSDRKVTPLGVKNGTRLMPKGTVIFVVRGSSLDTEFRIGLTQREVAFGQDCKALRARGRIDPAVLFVAIKSRTSEILQLVDHTGHGAGRLATDLISRVTIILPEEHLSPQVNMALRPLVEVGAARHAENHILEKMRDILLPKLMSGEIRVQEAEKIVEQVT
jgi:type I restriction enzyme S subunit